MLAYKATDNNMRCRGVQYKVGSEYCISENKKCIENFALILPELKENKRLSLCSSEVIHCGESLDDVFQYRWDIEQNRYFKVEILGEYNKGNNQIGTTRLKFLEEIKKEDVEKYRQIKERDRKDENAGLPMLREYQKIYSNLIIGGSTALYLYGVELDRTPGDWDLIHPFYINLTDNKTVEYSRNLPSGCDFEESYNIGGRKADLRIDSKTRYEIIEYRGHKYKVVSVFDILEAKCRYAKKGDMKHIQDVYRMLGVNKEEKQDDEMWEELPF